MISLFWEVYGQKKKDKQLLEKEKKENQQKLQQSTKILEETRQKKVASIGQLSALKERITQQEQLILNLKSEIKFLDREIDENSEIVSALDKDLKELKVEYGHMVYAAIKSSNQYSMIAFIFSSSSYYQLVTRLKLLKEYSRARRMQVDQIEKVTMALTGERTKLSAKRKEMATLLNVQNQENEKLLALRSQQDQLVKTLGKKEKELRQQIVKIQKSNALIEKLIADIIKEEIKKSTKDVSAKKIKLTPEAEMVSKSFSGNKSKLIWPVESGFISARFGKQPHPVLRNVTIDNLGVSIQTNKGEKVRSVFEGTVETIASVQGEMMIIIKHGDFFTIYKNLDNVYVKANQKVKAKDVIGSAITDATGITELQFQIWQNQNRLDPSAWLFIK